MKAYQKGICLAVATVMMAGCLTGCGGSKSGESKMEEAARMCAMAMIETDTESYLNLMPEECMEYLEDTYYVSEKQIKEAVQEYLEERIEGAEKKEIKERKKEVKKAKVEDSDELELDDIQELNEELNVIRVEEAYWLDFDCDYEDTVYQYNGRWYSYNAFERIVNLID